MLLKASVCMCVCVNFFRVREGKENVLQFFMYVSYHCFFLLLLSLVQYAYATKPIPRYRYKPVIASLSLDHHVVAYDSAFTGAAPEENWKPLTLNPPSTGIITPVTYDAQGRHRNATTELTSSGDPTRRIGVRLTTSALKLASPRGASVKGVVMYHGATAFTRILSFAHSQASDLVN